MATWHLIRVNVLIHSIFPRRPVYRTGLPVRAKKEPTIWLLTADKPYLP